jgi:hypothetical protein
MTTLLHEDVCKFMISNRIILRTENVSDESCRENQNTFYVQELFPENLDVSELVWKNIVEPQRPLTTM